MAVENADYIPELVPESPSGQDFVLDGDNEIRQLKKILQQQFPGVPVGPVSNAGENPSEPDEALTAPDNILLWSPKAIADFIKKYWADWGLIPTQTTAPCFSVYKSQTQTNSAPGGLKLVYEEIKFDDESAWDATNNRYTPQTAGRWLVRARHWVDLGNADDAGWYWTSIRKNDVEEYRDGEWSAQNGAQMSVYASGIVEVNGVDDYIEIFAGNNAINGRSPYSTEGGPVYFQGHYLGVAPTP